MSDTPAESDAVTSLQAAIRRLMNSFVHAGKPPAIFRDLPFSQFRIFIFISDNENMKMVDIAEKMDMKLPAISQVVDKLVRRGLILREHDLMDRRVVRLSLSNEARTAIVGHRQAQREHMQTVINTICESDVRGILAHMELLVASAEKVCLAKDETDAW